MTDEELCRWRNEAIQEKRFINTKAIDPKEVEKQLEFQNRIIRLIDKLKKRR